MSTTNTKSKYQNKIDQINYFEKKKKTTTNANNFENN